jgi:hypothetical protein
MRLTTRRPFHLLLAIGALASGTTVPCAWAPAQTLDLGAAAGGPKIGEKNGAADLAGSLENEVRELSATGGTLSGEAKSAALARARVRAIAAYLLRSGAERAWDESAPAALGARLALLVGRTDSVIDAAVSGRTARGEQLAPVDAKRAITLVDAIANAPIEPVRKAVVEPAQRLPAELVRALRATLDPLVSLAGLIEGTSQLDPWPVVQAATDPARSGATPARDVAELASRAGSLPEGAERKALEQAIGSEASTGAIEPGEAQLLSNAIECFRLLLELRAAPVADRIADGDLRSGLVRSMSILTRRDEPAARVALDALAPVVAASRAMLAMRRSTELPDAARRALAEAAGALLAGELRDVDAERARMRTAERIERAVMAATRLGASLGAQIPPEFRELIRQTERDARVALRTLPFALAAMAKSAASDDPVASVDPRDVSAIDRVIGLELDRTRVARLEQIIVAVGGVQPKAGRALGAVARRMTRMLADPLKRSEAEVALAALDAQFSAAFPLPYEDQLKRRTPRAIELTGGAPERVVIAAAAIRRDWCDAVAKGDFGGDASVRLDLAVRLCRALENLDRAVDPIDRPRGDRLALWGPWCTRRAMIAPATQDLTARASLASTSFLSASNAVTRATFERDLTALESATPLVRLAAGLEQRLDPLLRGDPDGLLAQLAPLVTMPSEGSYMRDGWRGLLALHRGLLEAEFARRTSDTNLRVALEAHLAALAREAGDAAFGPIRQVTKVPGFDGTQSPDDGSTKGASNPDPRPRGAQGGR